MCFVMLFSISTPTLSFIPYSVTLIPYPSALANTLTPYSHPSPSLTCIQTHPSLPSQIQKQRKHILTPTHIPLSLPSQIQKQRKAMEDERSEEHRLLRIKTKELNKL